MQNTEWSKTELRKGLDSVFKNAIEVTCYDDSGSAQECKDALAYLRSLKREVYGRLDIKRAQRKRS